MLHVCGPTEEQQRKLNSHDKLVETLQFLRDGRIACECSADFDCEGHAAITGALEEAKA